MAESRIKRRVFEIVQIPSAPGDVAGRMFDVLIITLIVLNTLAVIAETVPGVAEAYGPWLRAFELFSVVVFIVEYVLRVWTANVDPSFAHPVTGRLRFMATPFAIIDVLAILPVFFIGVDLRFVRVLRVLRVLKLGRYSESMQLLGDVLRRSRRELMTTLFMVMLALILMSSFVYYAEREAQPEAFSSIPAAFWWGIITLTTTGYGDIVPVTVAGRVLGGVTVLLGVATIALPVGILSSAFVEELQARRKKAADARAKGSACPHCGKTL